MVMPENSSSQNWANYSINRFLRVGKAKKMLTIVLTQTDLT